MFRVVIPARYASARLPGKVLLGMAGKPMIQWVYERARASRAHEVLIATDDLLIVSADTVDDVPPRELEVRLKKKYNHAEMRRMIMPGVVAVLTEFRLRESMEVALKRVDVQVMPNAVGGLSDVPDSWNVKLVLTANQRAITLLSSTRYSASAFSAFALKCGWELICKVPSPYNEHFVQFALRRK